MRIVLVAAVAALLAGCGGADAGPEQEPTAAGGAEQQEPRSGAAGAEAEPVHVHGLGLDGSALLIATHNGLFRLEAGESRPRVVGETRYDLMGFTVAGPGRFLASGHPDVRGMREGGLPPHLGLIESRDGGETWQSLSLLGEADFHVLRAAGERLYGFDATNGRFLASEDGGESWSEREAPVPLIDVAPDPDDPEHLVAAGPWGLQRSRDAGRSWVPLGEPAGLLAWPEGGSLHLVDADGSVSVSTDGESWERTGDVGGHPVALLGVGADELYVALHSGAIKHSRDGGETWTVRFEPAP